jgi:DNA-binding HxlR family transcriptional regulator
MMVIMALPNDYSGQACSMARSLEIIGERWTLLIIRDAFWGVRRFSDFAGHLGIPRAVLASRLRALLTAEVFAQVAGDASQEYQLTETGAALWPILRDLMAWGDNYCAQNGPRRLFFHAECCGPIDRTGHCAKCGVPVEVDDIVVAPGPGLEPPPADADWVTIALTRPHRLLQPLQRDPSPAGA